MTRKEMKLLSTGIGSSDEPLDLEHLESNVRFLLSRAKDKSGKPFDFKALEKGPKNLADLCTEIRDREARLVFDSVSCRARRYARSLKLHIHAEGYGLCEIWRRYQDGTFIRTNEAYALSETMKLGGNNRHIAIGSRRGFWGSDVWRYDRLVGGSSDEYIESPVRAAMRALLEELGIFVDDPSRFDKRAMFYRNYHVLDKRAHRESRVYRGVQSCVETHHLLLLLKHRPPRIYSGAWVKDYKTSIFDGWQRLRDYNEWQRSFEYSAA